MTKSTGTGFRTHHPRFDAIVGSAPTLELLAEHQDYPFAHEAGVFIAETNSLFITSNKLKGPDGVPHKVHIIRVDLNTNPVTYEEIDADIPMANGGVNYGKDVVFCGQGSLTQPGGLYRMSATAPYTSELLVGDFHGRPFNSVNDVIVHSDGSVWFTDPPYGFEQKFRPRPCLPSQVYRWSPQDGSLRVMADHFGKPNGICFSPDEKVVYVTDTDREHGDGNIGDHRASSM